MSDKKRQQVKSSLHPRNINRERYDLVALRRVVPELNTYIKPNKFGIDSIDFSNATAVKLLNTALLYHYYGIKYWKFPDENLCPPIPGRADYLHHMADLLGATNFDAIPTGDKITCLDVGTGASCIYPILGVMVYGWQFIASDVDFKSIASAQLIINSNESLKNKIECILQQNSSAIFSGILDENDKIDIVICNPPFHSSIEDAQKGTRRKIKNLSGKKEKTPERNFSGLSNELVYPGGEFQFIQNMIWESRKFSKNCFHFSSLVSKQSNLSKIYKLLHKVEAKQIKTIPLGTANKSSRIVTWTFLSDEEQTAWREKRWENE